MIKRRSFKSEKILSLLLDIDLCFKNVDRDLTQNGSVQI